MKKDGTVAVASFLSQLPGGANAVVKPSASERGERFRIHPQGCSFSRQSDSISGAKLVHDAA